MWHYTTATWQSHDSHIISCTTCLPVTLCMVCNHAQKFENVDFCHDTTISLDEVGCMCACVLVCFGMGWRRREGNEQAQINTMHCSFGDIVNATTWTMLYVWFSRSLELIAVFCQSHWHCSYVIVWSWMSSKNAAPYMGVTKPLWLLSWGYFCSGTGLAPEWLAGSITTRLCTRWMVWAPP